MEALEHLGYGFSVMSELSESDAFDVEGYAEVLRDWGWASEEQAPPSWYASRPPSRLAEEWLQVGATLGIQVTAPYTLALPSGTEIQVLAHVQGFGAPLGMLVLTTYGDLDDELEVAEQVGYGVALMREPHANEPFDLGEFVEVLRDWGWTAHDTEPPAWYMAK